MVRSLRAGLDQYMDSDLKRRMQAAAVDKAPSNTMQGLGFLLRKAMLGYDMGQDRKQRTAASGALTRGGKNQTKIIDAIKAQKAVEARPAMGAVSNQELYEMDAAPGAEDVSGLKNDLQNVDGGMEAAPAMAAREASPEIKAQMARIDPNSGALYGRSQALAELLKTDPDNPYAQGALLDNAGQLSNRNANLQLQQMKNQNALSTLAGTRAYDSSKLADTRAYKESEFDRQETKKENLRKTIFEQTQAENDRKFGRIKTPRQLEQAIKIAKANAGYKPLTDSQSKSGAFALRMEGADEIIKEMEAGEYDPTNIQDNFANMTPDFFSSYIRTEKGQLYAQAQHDWVTANLRKESGAVIGPIEMKKDIAKFFPMPGNSKALIKQKARARARAFAGMKASSGRGFSLMKSTMSDKGWSIIKDKKEK